MEAVSKPNQTTTQQLIIYLCATGLKPSEIAEQLGISPGYVSNTLKDDRSQFELRKLRHQLYGKDSKRAFNNLLPAATEVISEILENPNAKTSSRLTAAQEVFDRALGKPKQTLELEGSLIKEVFEKLDGRTQQEEPFDVTPQEETEQNLPLANPNRQADPIDKWADENL